MSRYKIKKPEFTATELNSNIAYGMTTVNNINQDELDSIQWLCEKSMNDDIKIADLQSQLSEKEKEIEYQESMKILAVDNQNKKAIEQLEKIINLFEPYENENKDTILCANNGISFLEYIDNQIASLKKGVE